MFGLGVFRLRGPIAALAFVASAALAALILRWTWYEPAVGVATLVGLAGVAVYRQWRRRRWSDLMRSGDLETILASWLPMLQRMPHPRTMAPLMVATAFASHGCLRRARGMLALAERGAAWEAALEHRLFLDAILFSFEGQRDDAHEAAAKMQALPLPPGDSSLQSRIMMLRRATAAFVRAFACESQDGDFRALQEAAEQSPLVHWAMRYAAAAIAADEGQAQEVARLIGGAPAWPEQSVLPAFHVEICAHASGHASAPHSPPA